MEFDGTISPRRLLECGVPQGSILGPLLFLIYVNDIQFSTKGTVLSFADDTTILFSSANLDDLYSTANDELSCIFRWFCANKLKLNENKTKYILVRPKHRTANLANLSIQINHIPLERIGEDCVERSTKFLGLYIDEYLKWNQHIAYLNKKIAYSLFTITQLKNTLPRTSLILLYHALVHPYLSNGLLAWGNASKKDLKQTTILQKKAMKKSHQLSPIQRSYRPPI